jgi:hypothetical protein
MNAGTSVGARSRAMLSHASAFRAKSFRSKSFRPPTEGELLSLCVAKEKVTKEKGHPACAPCGHPVRKVRGRATGFVDSTSCADAKLVRIHANHPAGFPSPARRYRGAPGRAAGLPGPHSVMELKSESEKSESESQSKAPVCRSFALDPALLKSAGQEGPQLYRGPCAAVRRGRQAAQRESTGMSTPFRTGRMPVRKARPRLTDLLGRRPNKRQTGCSFSLVTFSLSTQRESDSPSVGGRKLFALHAEAGKSIVAEAAPTSDSAPSGAAP